MSNIEGHLAALSLLVTAGGAAFETINPEVGYSAIIIGVIGLIVSGFMAYGRGNQ